MEVTEGTDKAHLGVAGPVDVVMEFQRHGATHHVNLHHTAQCHVKDRKTTERRPPSQEMSRAKPNKKKWFSRRDEFSHAPPSSAALTSMFDAQRDCKDRLGPVVTTRRAWFKLFGKQLPARGLTRDFLVDSWLAGAEAASMPEYDIPCLLRAYR